MIKAKDLPEGESGNSPSKNYRGYVEFNRNKEIDTVKSPDRLIAKPHTLTDEELQTYIEFLDNKLGTYCKKTTIDLLRELLQLRQQVKDLWECADWFSQYFEGNTQKIDTYNRLRIKYPKE